MLSIHPLRILKLIGYKLKLNMSSIIGKESRNFYRLERKKRQMHIIYLLLKALRPLVAYYVDT